MVVHRNGTEFYDEFGGDATIERPPGAQDVYSTSGVLCGCYTLEGPRMGDGNPRGGDGNFYGTIRVYTKTGWFDHEEPKYGGVQRNGTHDNGRYLPAGQIVCDGEGVTLSTASVPGRHGLSTYMPDMRLEYEAIAAGNSEPHNMIRSLAENARERNDNHMLSHMSGWLKPDFQVQLKEQGAINGLRYHATGRH